MPSAALTPRPSTTSSGQPLDLTEFLILFAPVSPARAAAAELYQMLETAPHPGTLHETSQWVESLLSWVVEPRSSVPLRGATRHEDARTGRMRTLTLVLTRCPAFAERTSRAVSALLQGASAHRLLVSTGLTHDRSFLSEAWARATRAMLPTAPAPERLGWMLHRAFRTDEARLWLATVPVDALRALLAVLQPAEGKPLFAPVKTAVQEAIALLSIRAASHGLSDEVIERSGEVPLAESPYLSLRPLALAALEGDPEAIEAFDRGIQRCRGVNALVVDQLEERGVSIELVFRLEVLERSLRRIEQLVQVGTERGDRVLAATGLLSQCLRDASREQSVRDLLRGSSARLARKVVERNGAHGEHYITRTRVEYGRMLLSAAGGGALTALTCWGKLAIAGLALPLMFQGLFHSANFALSFLVMQLVGFTLATKQPSMTAAALARTLAHGQRDYERTAEMVARIARSQFAAALGNVGAVIPTALLMDALVRWRVGGPILPESQAAYVVSSIDPRGGAMLVFAALTGFFLWFSSVAGGWFENWVVYRRLPAAIGHLRWVQGLLGHERASRFGEALGRHAAGVGTSVMLGVLLGATPALGTFIGVPIESRHVTLQTGSLTMAVAALGGLGTPGLGWAIAGIGCVVLLNFGVSFMLSLITALRAQRVPSSENGKLFRAIVRRFRLAPTTFFIPPLRRRRSGRGPALH